MSHVTDLITWRDRRVAIREALKRRFADRPPAFVQAVTEAALAAYARDPHSAHRAMAAGVVHAHQAAATDEQTLRAHWLQYAHDGLTNAPVMLSATAQTAYYAGAHAALYIQLETAIGGGNVRPVIAALLNEVERFGDACEPAPTDPEVA